MGDRTTDELFYISEFAGTRLPVYTSDIMPSISIPTFTRARDAVENRKRDCVLGIRFNGITRAYPLWIMDNVHIFGISIYLCLGNLILMSFSLPFILARASAVAFLCAVVVAIAMLIGHQVLYRCGLAIRLLKAQQKLAREVLRERKDARTTHGTTLMVQVMPADDV